LFCRTDCMQGLKRIDFSGGYGTIKSRALIQNMSFPQPVEPLKTLLLGQGSGNSQRSAPNALKASLAGANCSMAEGVPSVEMLFCGPLGNTSIHGGYTPICPRRPLPSPVYSPY
jgi:hypothetical protein